MNSEKEFINRTRIIGNDYETGLLGLLGELSALDIESCTSRSLLEAAIDRLVQPYSLLTDCGLYEEHFEADDHGHCAQCQSMLTDSHKVIHNGPEGWWVCNIDCAKLFAEEYFIPNKKAVLY